jgi:hypothetical protein
MTPKELRDERDAKIAEIKSSYAARILSAEALLPRKAPEKLSPLFLEKIKLAESAQKLRQEGLSYSEIGRRLNRSPMVIKGYLNIQNTSISIRAQNALRTLTHDDNPSAKKVSESVTLDDLKKAQNLGKKTVLEIVSWVSESGHSIS